MELSVFLILIPALYALYVYVKRKFTYWDRHGIPSASPLIPFGNVKELGYTKQISLLTQQYYNQFKGKGSSFCGLYFFHSPVALALDTDLIKSVLIKDFQHFEERGVYYNEENDPLSAHLFSLKGEKWRKLRLLLTPTFTSGKMKFMYPTITEVGKRFGTCLADITGDNKDVEIKDILARFSTDVIGTCAFGIECNSLADPNAEFRRMGRRNFEEPRHAAAGTFFIATFPKLAALFGTKIVRNDVSKFFMQSVLDTVAYREKNNVSRNDFMDLLINLKNQNVNPLTINEIASEAFVFFLAGFETSSTTMTFALYELALNLDMQSRLRSEIKGVLQKYNGELTYEAMLDMVYLDQIINETLRKYPPVGTLMRNVTRDYKVPGTNHIFARGTQLLIPVHGIHRDPNYYPDPEKFQPERFSAEAKAKRDPITYLPFGDGPRNCIGIRFGLMQTRVGLITLLLNFEISKCSKTMVPLIVNPASIVFSPKGGMWLNIRKL